jgi:hypothetical protein
MSKQMLTTQDFNAQGKIINMPDGVGAQDPATIAQLSIVTTILHVDGNRADTYTENGSRYRPFKTIGAAVTAGNALTVPFSIDIAPGSYADATVNTIAYPCVIHGRGATYVIGSGAGTITLANAFSMYDLTIIGNIVQSNTSLAIMTLAANVSLYGNLTIDGSMQYLGGRILGNGAANSLITIASTGMGTFQTLVIGTQVTNYYARIVSSGYLLLLNVELFANDNSNYAVTCSASGSSLTINGVLLYNMGTGGGINCANGATTQANEIITCEVFVNGNTKAIDCGTAYTYLDIYKMWNVNTGKALFPSGSNVLNSYFGDLSTSLNLVSYVDFFIAAVTYTNTKLTSINFPNLQNDNGAIVLSGCTSLVTLSIPNPVYLVSGVTLASVASFANFIFGEVGRLMQCGNITMSGCALTQSSVDNLLAVMESLDGTNGTTKFVGSIAIGGGTSASPTFTGQSGTKAGTIFSASATTCTVTWANHGFSTGDMITITGLTGPIATACNRTAVITVTDSGHFTYTISTAFGTGGGTATYHREPANATDAYSNMQRLIIQGATVSAN